MSKPGRRPVRGRPEQEAIGARVKAEREAAKVSREQLAAHLGLHVSMVGRIEKGAVALSAARAADIAALLGISIGRLYGRIPAAEHPTAA